MASEPTTRDVTERSTSHCGGVASEPAAIEATEVSKTYPGDVRALDRLSFRIERSEFVSVLGPSGCGKSTLLRIVAGLHAADAGGAIHVLGEPTTRPRPQTGIVFQKDNLLPWLTVRANLRLAAEAQHMPRVQIEARSAEVLATLGLSTFAERYPHELSGGMRQRAAFGQMLVLHPDVLLLDEPFGALDALTRDRLNVELLRLWQVRQQTVLLITHSIAEAVFLSDRVLVMSERPGRIIADLKIRCARPRDPQNTRASPEFTAHVLELSRMMGVV